MLRRVLAFFIVVGFICYLLYNYEPAKVAPPDPQPVAAAAPKPEPQPEATAEQQADRKAFTSKLQQLRIITKTEWSGSLPKVWVGHAFHALSESDRNQFLSPVYAWWDGERRDFGRKASMTYDPLVVMEDNGTPIGKRLGVYDPLNGYRPN